jgi:hypothetical protein
MPSYLIEIYLARCTEAEREARETQVRSAAEELAQTGARVSFDGSIHVPEDELCFLVFAAPTAEQAALVARHAGLEPLRVVEALPSRKEHNR